MTRRVGILAAWLVATAVAVAIAATAVGSVRGNVTDVPAIPDAGTVLLTSTTTTSAPTTTSAGSPTTSIVSPSTTQGITTTTAVIDSTTTSTTALESTTTTAAPNGLTIMTYELVGGQVTISADHPTIGLVAAVPSAGFAAEVRSAGPEEVRVEFLSTDHKSSFRAEWDDGRLDVELDESGDDD